MTGFQLISIYAVSGHPVRNSRKRLITGPHYLWKSDSAPSWPDGNRGSFAPNIFLYTFGRPVKEAGHLEVTVKLLDSKLINHQLILTGSAAGRRILETDYFTFRNTSAGVVLRAYFTDPQRSGLPFDRNTDVSWEIRRRESPERVVGKDGPTRLELYWLSPRLHPALWNGIPVELLRVAFGASARNLDLEETENDDVDATAVSPWYAQMTRLAFFRCNKQYDTQVGESSCNCE